MSEFSFRDEVRKIVIEVGESVEKELATRISILPFDPEHRATYEVVGGLLGRQATLCTEFGMSPNSWTCHLAPIILRAMADAYITFCWILLDPNKRAQEYIRYALGQVKLEIEYRKARQNSDANSSIINDMELWLNSQRWDFLTEVNLGSWSGMSTRKMAEEVGCEDFYRAVYEPFSACVHNTWRHIEPYNLEWCDNELHIPHRIPRRHHQRPDPFHFELAGKYLDKTFRKFDEVFSFESKGTPVQKLIRTKFTELINGLKGPADAK